MNMVLFWKLFLGMKLQIMCKKGFLDGLIWHNHALILEGDLCRDMRQSSGIIANRVFLQQKINCTSEGVP